MKTTFTILFLLVFLVMTKAQPTILSNVLPAIGDTILMSLDSTLVAPGNSGSNVTWDFSSSIKQDIFIERVYLDPTQTQYGLSFPNAKLCRTDGIGSVYSYWDNTNANKSIYYGFVEKNIYDQNYNALPLNYYKFPITYGNSYVDSISALTNPGALVGAGKYLKLPNKTITNVLRTKSLIYVGDSSPSVNSYSLTTEYAWYQSSKKEPLLVISSVIINHVLHKKFVIFDNSPASAISEIEIIDVLGRLVYSTSNNFQTNANHIEMNNLHMQPGTYHVLLISDGKIDAKKSIVVLKD